MVARTVCATVEVSADRCCRGACSCRTSISAAAFSAAPRRVPFDVMQPSHGAASPGVASQNETRASVIWAALHCAPWGGSGWHGSRSVGHSSQPNVAELRCAKVSFVPGARGRGGHRGPVRLGARISSADAGLIRPLGLEESDVRRCHGIHRALARLGSAHVSRIGCDPRRGRKIARTHVGNGASTLARGHA